MADPPRGTRPLERNDGLPELLTRARALRVHAEALLDSASALNEKSAAVSLKVSRQLDTFSVLAVRPGRKRRASRVERPSGREQCEQVRYHAERLMRDWSSLPPIIRAVVEAVTVQVVVWEKSGEPPTVHRPQEPASGEVTDRDAV